jgi:23S rRNA U2552 (ribose-2'-O)-methylase RlmE/FtsJ
MNDLEKYFYNNQGRLIHKWLHYFEIYDRHFNRFRGKEIVIVEIGVFNGGSLQMWKNYFGDKAKIYGIDINPRVKELEEDNIKILIGSQSDKKFLRKIKGEIPDIDILIDDGGHKMNQQIITFQELYDKIKPDGVYLCEDLLTSYQLLNGGGHKRRGTFIEFTKNWIDQLNAYYSEQSSLKVDALTKSMNSVHYYDSVVVVEKRPHAPPVVEKRGVPVFPDEPVARPQSIRFSLLVKFNQLLRLFRLPSYKFKG